jgi:regulator of replication initiation timing
MTQEEALQAEVGILRARIDDLLRSNTALVEERRDLSRKLGDSEVEVQKLRTLVSEMLRNLSSIGSQVVSLTDLVLGYSRS